MENNKVVQTEQTQNTNKNKMNNFKFKTLQTCGATENGRKFSKNADSRKYMDYTS